MKKVLLFLLLLTQFAFGQINTSTVKAGKYQMNIPDTGTKFDSAVVWNGATKLMKILPVSEIKGTTNLNQLATATNVIIYSDTGSDAAIPLVTTVNSGAMSPADKIKLNGIDTGATANQTDSYLLARSNHTGTQAISTITGLQPALDTKVDKVTGKSLLSDTEITRLGTLANYTHPANHPPSIITQDGSNRFVTDAEKATWNAKQSALGYTAENTVNKNVANGYAGLGSDGKLISSQLPSITISDTFVTASQAAMLAVSAETGDVSVRTDLNKSFILRGANPAVLGDWQELLTPTSAVTTVFGRNGAVTAQKGDYNTSQVTENANLYYTEARVNANTNVAANTAARHNAVTLGTANGLILSTQALSLGLSSTSATGALSSTDWNTFNSKQPAGSYEPAFTKNTAFNKNFGISAGTVAEGNDSRILNGQTAYGWGNHAGLYLPLGGGVLTGAVATNLSSGRLFNYMSTEVSGNYGVYRQNNGSSLAYFGDANGSAIDGGGVNDFAIVAPNGKLILSAASDVLINGGLKTFGSNYTYLHSSNFSSYALPLAGGTLTGALKGTTATFTGTISGTNSTANSRALIINGRACAQGTAQSFFDNAPINLGGEYGSLLFGGDNSDGQVKMQVTNGTGAIASGFRLNPLGGEVIVGTTGVNSLLVQGNLRYSGTLSQVSDIRVKKNIRPLNNSLDKITKINCYTYDRTDDNSKNQMGVIAQELEQIYPELITTGKYGEIEDFKTVNYSGLIPALIEAIKQQQAEIIELKKQIGKINLNINKK